MPSHYSNILIGFLATRPGPDPRRKNLKGLTWETPLPMDDIHREAIRLGLIESAGAPVRPEGGGTVHRPFRLTTAGLELRQGALDAKRREGDEGPTLAEWDGHDKSEVRSKKPTNADGFIGLLLFAALIFIGVVIVWALR